MKTRFSFGKNGIEVSVPEGFDCQVIRSRSGAALKDAAAALDTALDMPAEARTALGARARAAVQAQYTVAAMQRATLEVYRALLAKAEPVQP